MAPSESVAPMSTPDPSPPPPPPPQTPPNGDDDDDEGEVGNWFTKMFGKSWKTSAAGIIAIMCSIVQGLQVALPGQLPPLLVAIAGVIGPLVGGVGLLAAKDHNK